MSTMLYRGETNNGVHTVLTDDAVEYLERRREIVLNDGSYDNPRVADCTARAAHGIFTFIREEMMESAPAYFRGRITGTLEELDAWTAGTTLPGYHRGNYVPFSNAVTTADDIYIRTAGEVIRAFGLQPVQATA